MPLRIISDEKTNTNQDALENLVIAEVLRLHQDQSKLENLRDQLPERPAHSSVEMRFLSLWRDVEVRADRLERLLDRMTWRGAKPPARVICISPPVSPSAA